MRNIALLSLSIVIGIVGIACGSQNPSGTGDTPSAAYRRLYAAVKSKNTEAIKKEMSKKTQDFAGAAAQRQNTPVEKVFENGFTATTFANSLPEIRDERVNGEMGAVEVWNSKDSRWEDLPFVKEADGWKLAVGDLFAGTFNSPGKGRAAKEQEAANVMSNNMNPANPAGNINSSSVSNTTVVVPQAQPNSNAK